MVEENKRGNGQHAHYPYNNSLIQISTTKEALDRGFLPTGDYPVLIITEIETDLTNKVKIYIPKEKVPEDARVFVPEIPHSAIGHGKSMIAVQFYR